MRKGWARLAIFVVFASVAQAQATLSITSVKPNADLKPGDSVTFTVNISKTPANDTKVTSVTVSLYETINGGDPRLALRGSSGFSSTGTAQVSLGSYTVPALICRDSSTVKCKANPSSLSDLIQRTQLEIIAVGPTTPSAREILNVRYPDASLSITSQPMNSKQIASVRLSGSSFASNASILLIKSSGANGCPTLNTPSIGSFTCYISNFADNMTAGATSASFTLYTLVQNTAFRSEADNVNFIGTYDVLVSWYEDVPASPGIGGGGRPREAVILGGFTVAPPPTDDAIQITKITGFTSPSPGGPQTPFTWFPGETPVLNAPTGGRLTLSRIEGTYRLSKYSQAIIFPVLKANGHLYGVGYSYVRVTYGKDTPLMDYGYTPAGPTYAFIDLPNDPITSFEVVLMMSPPDEKITDYTTSNVVDFIATRSFAKSNSIVGTGALTADLAITYIQPVQVVHNFPPPSYAGPAGTDYKHDELPLIARRPTIVRVWIKNLSENGTPVDNVTAILRGQFRNPPVAFDLPNPLQPFTPPLTAQPYSGPLPLQSPPNFAERTIDFQLPDAWVQAPGGYTIQIELVLPNGVTDPDTTNNTLTRTIALRQQPRDELSASPNQLVVGWIPVCSAIPGVAAPDCPSPQVGNMTQFITNTFPVSTLGSDTQPAGLRFFRADTIPRQLPGTITTQAQVSAWMHGTLRSLFYRIQSATGQPMDFLVAFITDVTPSTVGAATNCPGTAHVPPCLAGGTSDGIWAGGEGNVVVVVDSSQQMPAPNHFTQNGGFNWSSMNVAHELGHVMGLEHVLGTDPPGCPSNAAVASCPNWPYSSPRIQFPGYVPATHTLLDGNRTYDLMSYCGNVGAANLWISPFSYRWLFDHDLAPSDRNRMAWNPCLASPEARPNSVETTPVLQRARTRRSAAPQEYLMVSGTARQDGSGGTLDPVFRLTTTQVPRPGVPGGSHCVRFLDAGGATLSDYCFDLSFTGLDGEVLDPQAFSFLVAPPAGMARIDLMRGSNTLASIGGSTQPPSVTITSPQAGDTWQSGTHSISWSGSGPLSYILDYSTDGGSHWMPVTTPSTDTSLTIDSANLHGGSNVFFRVQASDGLNTATTQAGPITIVQAPRASVTPSVVDFRNSLIGVGVSRQVELRNIGTGPLHVATAESSSAAFQLVSPSAPFTLAAGDRLTLELRFVPPSTGPATGMLKITSDAADNPTLSISFQGNGIEKTAPDAAVTPASLDFGSLAPGGKVNKDITVQNFGPAELNVTSYSVSGAGFSLTDPPGPFTLAPSETRTITVQATAGSSGTQAGSLSIQTNDPANPTLTVPLRLTVNQPGPTPAPKISVPSAPLDFGSVAVGQSQTATLSIGNTGNAPLNVTGLNTAAPFAVISPAAPFTVAAGANATLTLRFSPTTAGLQTGKLTIASNDTGSSSVSVNLSGTGAPSGPAQAPAIEVTPAALDFGSVVANQTKDLTVTVRNNGTAALVVSSATSSNPRFSVVNPSTPFNVAAGASQTITVRFGPTSAGSQTGTLTIASNDPVKPTVTVNLTGTAPGTAGGGTTLLSIDDGTFENSVGVTAGAAAVYFVNRLTPPSYPATLKSVQIMFLNLPAGLKQGDAIRVLVGANSSGSANINNVRLLAAPSSVGAVGQFNSYDASSAGITIQSGDFVVGFTSANPPNVTPAALDITDSKQRSYASSDGLDFQQLTGNLGIRATVDLGSAGTSVGMNPTTDTLLFMPVNGAQQ